MVSFRFHYSNSGFDLWYFLNDFFVFCENPQRMVRADELRVWGSRGRCSGTCIPLHIVSSMDRHSLCRGMHGEQAAGASSKTDVTPFVISIWPTPKGTPRIPRTPQIQQHEKAGREPEQYVSREVKSSNEQPPSHAAQEHPSKG